MSRFALALIALFPFCVARAQVVVNFDLAPDGTPITTQGVSDQWAGWGVVFGNESGSPVGVSNNNCSVSAPNHAYANAIVARFVDPATGLPSATRYAGTRQDWCWVPDEGVDMAAYYANGVLLDQQFNSGGGNLVAFSNPEPVIAYLVMTPMLQGIDDFTFEQPASVCVGDLDGDGVIGLGDLTILLSHFGAADADYFDGDLNVDGVVDLADLTNLLSRFGSSCP